MIKLIVDSTCDIPEDYISKYDIDILPLRLLINNNEYLDKVDITIEEVYKEMRSGVVPKTSQVSPKDIYEVFDKNCKQGNDFIYLAFSAVMSGTCNLAANILEELKDRYPERKMTVIDSKGGASATGLMAVQVLKMIDKGYLFEDIVKCIIDMTEHIEHIFSLSDLYWIMKGGRISRTGAVLGTMLDLKPILDVNNGSMEVIKKVRGKKKALNTLVDMLEERMNGFTDQTIWIAHADDIGTAEQLVKIIKNRLGENTRCIVNKIGCVLGIHLGIGGVGLFFLNKKPDKYID